MSDAERYLAAFEFLTKVTERTGDILTAADFHKTVHKIARALPPFTPLNKQEGAAE